MFPPHSHETLLTGLRLLLVEDDPRITQFLQRGLEAEGHTVDIAMDKAHCLSQLETQSYDVILLDIYLGSDNGLDMCREWKTQGLNTPVLVMTANEDPGTALASHQAGAAAYLQKPFPFELLISTIRAITKTERDSFLMPQTIHTEYGTTP